ncbi:MAG: STT3 domain-containing protein [Candidatus Jordarchaeales archaeon]
MDRRNLLLVLSVSLITLLAFLLRLYPFFMYPPYISDYDSTIQYYNAAFISIYGYSAWFGWYNPMMWYPYGLDMSRSYLPGVPFTAATLFFLLRSIGFNVNIHMVCYFLPAIMGAASCVVLFFLGREVLDDKAGLISSFLLSFLPGAIERTIAGLVDNECVGLFFFLLSLFFFIRSMKRSSIPSAVIAGLALGGFIASWGAAIYLLYVYPLTVILLILMKRYSTNLLMTYSITILIGAFIGTRVPFHGSEYIISSNCILAMLVLLALISWEAYPRIKPTLASISETLAVKAPKLHVFVKNKRNLAVTIFIIVIVIMTGVAVAYSINPIFSLSLSSGIRSFIQISGRYFSVINPFYREEEIIVSSVAEHATTSWSMFFYDLHATVILFPAGMYLLFQRRRNEDLLLIILGATTVYMAASMVRLIVMFAPVACLLSGFALSSIYDPLSKLVLGERRIPIKRRRVIVKRILGRESAAVVLAITGLILFFSFSHGMTVAVYSGAPQFVPRDRYGNFYFDWEEAFIFMQNKLPSDAIVVSWWDYGYWIMVRGNKTTVVDNATLNTTQIALVGRALTTTNETESLEILRYFNATHVLVYFGHNDANLHGDEGKWIWMAKISFDVFYTPWEYEYYTPTLTGTIYTPKFFNMTLYKLLYYHDPSPDVYPSYSKLILDYALHNYMDQNKYPLVISYDEARSPPGWYSWWKHGFSVLNHFKPVFISSNHLVKIYKIDYSILDANMDIVNASIYTNGSGTVEIRNTGLVPFNVTRLYVNGTSCSISAVSIGPGETATIPFNSGLSLESGKSVPLKIETSIPEFTREINVEVSAPP